MKEKVKQQEANACLFCGSLKLEVDGLYGTRKPIRVVCKKCGAEGPASHKTATDAIRKWNASAAMVTLCSAWEILKEIRDAAHNQTEKRGGTKRLRDAIRIVDAFQSNTLNERIA